MKPCHLVTLVCALALSVLSAAPEGTLTEESQVPAYTLPDPLVSAAGKPISDADAWTKLRRPEILALFETQVYGRTPPPALPLTEEISRDESALNGKATRLELRLTFAEFPGVAWYLLLYLPDKAASPAPAFLGLNFNGNYTVDPDPGIRLSTAWMRQSSKSVGVIDHRATEASRGTSASRWPVEKIIERGYALATMYYGDIDPDFDDGFQNGIHGAMPSFARPRPAPDEWGSISAWAWGLSRVMDSFETTGLVDGNRVAVLGHSRLGKTSLWAGARDERFAIVISNNSGCGGAALSRRVFGETVERINTSFPHWFCDNFTKYNSNEAALPVDQHMLLALIAPRPVYVASATEDLWADPRGEFLSAKNAEPVYTLFGKEGLGVDAMPPPDQSVGGSIGYHLRTGAHDLTEFDWEQYLDFADRHFLAAGKVKAAGR